MPQPLPTNAEKVISKGSWGGGTSWELVLTRKMPPAKLCTAVACVAIQNIDDRTITLTKNVHSKNPARKNKWEVLAGHIDPLDPAEPEGRRETPRQALAREALEESGFVIKQAGLFGYRRVRNAASSDYPPLAYMPYYWATTNQGLRTPTDPGQPRERTFPIEKVRGFVAQRKMQPAELEIIELGLGAALYDLRGVTGA